MNLKSSFFENKSSLSRILHEDLDASKQISNELLSLLPVPPRPIVIACIGTDRSTGDSLGPLVGTLLKEKTSSSEFFVYGTFLNSIHAMNLKERLHDIQQSHLNIFIIGCVSMCICYRACIQSCYG